MARKNKVEASPHYNEIVKRLSCGESGRSVSRWLENTYNEKISFAALNRYKSKHIKMEDRVEAELNKRQELKKKNEYTVQNQDVDEAIQEQADKKEAAEDTMSIVAQTIADNMEGVAKVAAELPEIFERAKRDAKDPECATEWRHVASISIQANKLYNDYFKHEESNIEINVNEGFEELADALKKSRELCQTD